MQIYHKFCGNLHAIKKYLEKACAAATECCNNYPSFYNAPTQESTTFAYDKFKNKGELIMVTKTFKVEGMKCSHCKAHVEEAIQALPGVEKAEAHLDAANVAVDFDAAKVSAEAIKKAVDEAGHYELILE